MDGQRDRHMEGQTDAGQDIMTSQFHNGHIKKEEKGLAYNR